MDDDFDSDGRPRPWRDRLGDWLRPTPAEIVGLALLFTGALAATALVVWQASQRPTPPPPAAATAIHGAHDDGWHPGAAPSAEDDHGQHAGHGHPDPPDVAQGPVVVHVTGAVARPGVVELPDGGRVADAIDAAGGPLADAALDRLNLARPLEDGEHVHLPRPDEEPRPDDAAHGAAGGAADGRVDLNRADAQQLETLPGIGPSKAQAIVRHREEHGPFAVPGDIRAVPGIGEKTFQQLAELVTVS